VQDLALNLTWFRVGVDEGIQYPLPFIPSHQSLRLETEGRGKFLANHLENVRKEFSDLKCNNPDKLQCFIGRE